MNTKQLVKSIQTVLEPGDVAYINVYGEWYVGKDGRQNGHTQAIGYDDFENCSIDEIEETLIRFVENYV